MFIHFDLPCDRDTQQKLHQEFRHKIQEWKEQGLIKRVVLTYHFPNGSLYVCLDIPDVKRSTEGKTNLCLEEVNQIPKSIMNSIDTACKENGVKLRIIDFEIEIEQAKKRSEKNLSLIHISEPTRRYAISYAVFCLKKKNKVINCDA